ncbi:lipid asymmetry maintenance protein MlaB [Comamonas sp. GB3 AK4-5]|uniref:STAS domain-containing protein n=1 Tax=Comamonas sp. GB3 AK4-5 TaxID=3231487 RepID=UPI00351F48D8
MSQIALPAQLDGDQAAALLPQLRRQIEAQASAPVVLDAAAIQRFDSATLALLLECRRLTQSRQQVLELRNLPAGMLSMAHVYGVDGLLGLPVSAAADELA